MCVLLKLHDAKFDVPRLFCSKVIKEKSLGGRLDQPPSVQEGLSKNFAISGSFDEKPTNIFKISSLSLTHTDGGYRRSKF